MGDGLLEVVLVRYENVTHLSQLYLAVSVTAYELLLWRLAMPLFLTKSLPCLQGAFQVHRIS